MRLMAAILELAGYAAIAACIVLIEPRLLIGIGGLAAIAVGTALARRIPE